MANIKQRNHGFISTGRGLRMFNNTGCQLDFVKKKKKKFFFKGSVFKKKKRRKVFNAREKVFLLCAYLNKNSKR